jgi:ferric-dicitrate binding protein FerR (iron transport regulator)
MGTMTSDDNDSVGRLLRTVGPREAVPFDRMRRVRAAAHSAWRRETRARTRRIMFRWTLAATGVAAILIIGFRLTESGGSRAPREPLVLASVETLNGAVRLIPSTAGPEEPRLLQRGNTVGLGEGVDSTSGGAAALGLPGGVIVRIDRGTRLRLLSKTAVALDEGAIYVDSSRAPGGGQLEVRTPVGMARDIGTRFEVRFSRSTLRVRVRDGLVTLSQGRASHDAVAGEELTLEGDGRLARRTVPVSGTDWDWIDALSPSFDLEGRSLREFLDWIARENGWRLEFDDPAVEEQSRTTTLHGSIQGLTPDEALSAVLPTVGVEHSLQEGVLRIRRSEKDTKG